MKVSRKLIFVGVSAVILAILAIMTIGINDAGERTVIQYPNGSLVVKFTPGVYFHLFGKTTEYNDLITFDFDRSEAEGGAATLDQKGISVRYQDGGMGTVFGKARFSLPSDSETMIALHKAFRSNSGVANKLIKSVTEEAMNLTAGLMNSEDAYATKRAIYTELAKTQVVKGKFVMKLKNIDAVDEVGKTVTKQVPVIREGEDGMPMHVSSDLERYGISLVGFQLNDPGFEERTQKQIADKREATMAIITAKANAERAKQEAITAEENGKKNVMTAKYEKEKEKIQAVVDANKAKEVAEIAAAQQVAVAEQAKLEAEQKKLAAVEYKQEQILIGEGDGERKRLVMAADGALEQKLKTYEAVMAQFANAVSKQKWVPEVQMGNNSGDAGGNEAANLINLLTAKTLQDLGLDMSIPKSEASGQALQQ